MNSHFHNSQTRNPHTLKPNKKRLSRDQLQILEESFHANPKLKPEFKLELAQQLGVSPRQVAIWYQNRKARHKTETKEHELRCIQQELGNVLADKIRLEREVLTLKNKLQKAREMLGHALDKPRTAILSGSVSEYEPPYSYSPGNMSYKWPCSGFGYPANMLQKYVSNQSRLIESVDYDQETYSDCKM